ncbi:MarR family winged helix-turn-helix transcriptional regulator [Streptomyces sp. NBC_01803]|uniref:MarR family winged helix-turn-helix transcriptional regulator n=1 Tax=Streptomyces sp. NBC_01803 TaxID=2975946 RepID=UPI002DDA2AD9|nr:MarR family transcriptional regulator [Streptomyces sp. NBC_01803]WSA43018.1 MarR family transcriptional regulator [Streptomyces sp. NBC_01803]
MGKDRVTDDPAVFQETMGTFIRAFGLHQPELTPHGQPIPVSEAHALGELAREGELRQVELARRLRLVKSTVSRLVGQLAARGWVERSSARADGRGVVLRLTPAGQRAAEELATARRERFSRLLGSIPEHERAGVLHSLGVLVEALDE